MALNDLRTISLPLAYIAEEFGPRALGKRVVEQWFADTLPANHPARQLLVERLDMQI